MSRPQYRSILTLLVVIALAGCQTTRQTRSVETTGFLGDYSQLQPGGDEQAQLVYTRANTNWSAYDAVMIDSVELWKADETELTAEESQQLTDYLYKALHDELSKEFRIATAPGEGVLRLRAAMTEAKGARVVGNAVTSIVPQLRLLNSLLGAASDVQVFVGRASVEAEITDSVSKQRLLAAVDQRSGTKAIRGGLAKWSDVKLASDFWAERVRTRLGELGVQRTK